jgi:hypothetical protein
MTLRLPMTAAHIIALTGGRWPCQKACSAAAEERRADMGDPYSSNNIALMLSCGAVVLLVLVPDALAVRTPYRCGCGYRLFIVGALNAAWASGTRSSDASGDDPADERQSNQRPGSDV